MVIRRRWNRDAIKGNWTLVLHSIKWMMYLVKCYNDTNNFKENSTNERTFNRIIDTGLKSIKKIISEYLFVINRDLSRSLLKCSNFLNKSVAREKSKQPLMIHNNEIKAERGVESCVNAIRNKSINLQVSIYLIYLNRFT